MNTPAPKRTFDFKSESTLLALFFLAICLAFATKGDFLLPRNFTNLTLQVSINALLAVGMTFVILTGGIDLSVGSVVAISGIVAGMAQVHWGLDTLSASLLAIGSGFLCGIINGPLIAYMKIPPFVITLGMMVIAGGAALILSDSSAISPMSDSFKAIAKGHLDITTTAVLFGLMGALWIYTFIKRFKTKSQTTKALLAHAGLELICLSFSAINFCLDRGVPYPVLILGVVAILSAFVLKKLPIGRFIYAIGGNEEAAALSGIAVAPIKAMVYALMGTIAGLAGVVLTARLNSAAPTAGALMELDAIAAVVIGGTSLKGGLGTVRGSIIGAFFIGTVNNGMDLLGIDSNYQMVIKGLIIIIAVGADARSSKKASQ